MDSEIKSKLMSIEEAANAVGLKVSRLRYEVFLKRIPHVKIGRSVRFTREQLDTWVSSNIKNGDSK